LSLETQAELKLLNVQKVNAVAAVGVKRHALRLSAEKLTPKIAIVAKVFVRYAAETKLLVARSDDAWNLAPLSQLRVKY